MGLLKRPLRKRLLCRLGVLTSAAPVKSSAMRSLVEDEKPTLSGRLAWKRSRGSEERPDTISKIGLGEELRRSGGYKSRLFSRALTNARSGGIATGSVGQSRQKCLGFDEPAIFESGTAALATLISKVVGELADLDVPTILADPCDLVRHEVFWVTHDASALPDAPRGDYLGTRSVLADSQHRRTVELDGIIAAKLARSGTALLNDLETNTVHGEAVRRDDGRPGQRVDEEPIKQALLLTAELEGVAIILLLPGLDQTFLECSPAHNKITNEPDHPLAEVIRQLDSRQADDPVG